MVKRCPLRLAFLGSPVLLRSLLIQGDLRPALFPYVPIHSDPVDQSTRYQGSGQPMTEGVVPFPVFPSTRRQQDQFTGQIDERVRDALPFGPSAFPVPLARALQLRGSSALGRGGQGVDRFLSVTYPST